MDSHYARSVREENTRYLQRAHLYEGKFGSPQMAGIEGIVAVQRYADSRKRQYNFPSAVQVSWCIAQDIPKGST